MKKGISQWAFSEDMMLKDCFKLAKDAGFDSVEVAIAEKGEITLNSTKKDIQKIVDASRSTGIEISSLATGLFWDYSLTSDNSLEREKAKGIVKKMIEVASWLGVDTILIVPGAVDVFFKPDFMVVTYEKVYERAHQTLKELAPMAEEYKVNIAIENVWNKFLLSPIETKNFVDSIGSPYVGVYFDVGNVLLYGYPEQWIRILGKRIKRVHVKDYKQIVGMSSQFGELRDMFQKKFSTKLSFVQNFGGFCNILEGDVNFKEVMKALKQVGYNSYVTAEFIAPLTLEKGEDPREFVMSIGRNLDKVLGLI